MRNRLSAGHLLGYHGSCTYKAVILVVDLGICDGDLGGGSDVEGIGIVPTSAVTSRVVNGDGVLRQVSHGNECIPLALCTYKLKVRSTVDGETLNRGVLDVQVLNDGVRHGVGVEELWLGLAAVGALAVPPLGTVAINNVPRGTADLDEMLPPASSSVGRVYTLSGSRQRLRSGDRPTPGSRSSWCLQR